MNFDLLISACIGYLLGSIPFALVIGQVFYKTDVREFGSGNLGGSNAGRVLGKKAAISVIALDLLKVVLASGIAFHLFGPTASIWAGLFAAIGHCYPVFAGFRGGKAVATMFGYLLSCALFTFQSPWVLLIPLTVFLILFFTFKMVSLASLGTAIASSIYIIFATNDTSILIASILLSLLVIYRHKDNLVRIKNGNENKVKWLTKKQ